jgi:xanthine/CO dehydrogenase XdhC/CoxF family maturation factor
MLIWPNGKTIGSLSAGCLERLDLGSETPEEIALAIVSEVQRVFAAASGESLRERKMSIHAPVRSAVLV